MRTNDDQTQPPTCTCGGAQRIAELELALKRKTIELEVRVNVQPAPREVNLYEYGSIWNAGWRGVDLKLDRTNSSQLKLDIYAAGRAAVEMELAKRMEGK